MTTAVRPFLVTRKGFSVVVQATSSSAAALQVMRRYGFWGASAKPVVLQ